MCISKSFFNQFQQKLKGKRNKENKCEEKKKLNEKRETIGGSGLSFSEYN
jgi:hypothetical protein